MDWYRLLWGFIFFLTGIILILVRYSYNDSKSSSWLDISNARLVSGGIFGIIVGLYCMLTSF